jgi:hypothetical protein
MKPRSAGEFRRWAHETHQSTTTMLRYTRLVTWVGTALLLLLLTPSAAAQVFHQTEAERKAKEEHCARFDMQLAPGLERRIQEPVGRDMSKNFVWVCTNQGC